MDVCRLLYDLEILLQWLRGLVMRFVGMLLLLLSRSIILHVLGFHFHALS
jgi:hypothetical protein